MRLYRLLQAGTGPITGKRRGSEATQNPLSPTLNGFLAAAPATPAHLAPALPKTISVCLSEEFSIPIPLFSGDEKRHRSLIKKNKNKNTLACCFFEVKLILCVFVWLLSFRGGGKVFYLHDDTEKKTIKSG